ncbi:hypothetical protein [Lichenicoccus roseus]|uniref:Uncharacterized protein n=1 Tax=Lichenicoccus roseus TaxID=2683649 RepID=A0A5R9J6R2_9PROT|nr:hypothetical protein [Lichenicoccus roseus]TLU72177.1 hypothetical protein FE263_13760 [Lichenicoccus roseus]
MLCQIMVVSEFVCVDCRADITAAGSGQASDRCGVCDWLAAMPDRHDRARLRGQMLRIGLIGPTQ